MQVKEYLLYYKMTPQEFADFVGVHLNTIRSILNARHKSVRFDVYQKIIEKTEGKVTLEDLIKEVQGIDPIYPKDK